MVVFYRYDGHRSNKNFFLSVQLTISSDHITIGDVFSIATPAENKKLEALFQTINVKREKYGASFVTYFWVENKNTYASQERFVEGEKFENIYSELYPGMDAELMLDHFIDSEEALLILIGKPGTGKTSMIKKLIHTVSIANKAPATAIYIKDQTVLQSPNFWAHLEGLDDIDLLILDDLDRELTPREDVSKGETTIVNQLLSYSNGIFPKDTKIVITTNLTEEGIDRDWETTI